MNGAGVTERAFSLPAAQLGWTLVEVKSECTTLVYISCSRHSAVPTAAHSYIGDGPWKGTPCIAGGRNRLASGAVCA